MKKRFFKYGLRPIIEESDNDIKTYFSFQWNTGKFIEDMTYYTKINHDLSGEAEELTKEEFDLYVKELMQKL